jgi:hypothetical protein
LLDGFQNAPLTMTLVPSLVLLNYGTAVKAFKIAQVVE